MTTFEFIKAAYEAPNDEGDFDHFKRKYYEAAAMMEGHAADPIAAFLAAVVIENGNNIPDAVDALDFFTGELLRAVKAIQNAGNDEGE